MVGDAALGPLLGGRDERLLHRVLGGGEVAEAAHDDAEHLRRQRLEQLLAGGVELAVAHGRALRRGSGAPVAAVLWSRSRWRSDEAGSRTTGSRSPTWTPAATAPRSSRCTHTGSRR